jgi:hypothetical protein
MRARQETGRTRRAATPDLLDRCNDRGAANGETKPTSKRKNTILEKLNFIISAQRNHTFWYEELSFIHKKAPFNRIA